MDSIPPLDTPRRESLASHLAYLRIVLKDWEKSFAASHAGKKPEKDDIKADIDIAKKYKEYSKLRDGLAGRIGCGLAEVVGSPTHERKRSRKENFSPKIHTPNRDSHKDSPQLGLNEPCDATCSLSPRPLLSAIGPTPQRDGKVLGLFDLLSSSQSSSATSRTKKRKIDDLSWAIALAPSGAETPSRQQLRSQTALGQEPTPQVSNENNCSKTYSRTPVSEGKKFMLSQFSTTPDIPRYASTVADPTEKSIHGIQNPQNVSSQDSTDVPTPTQSQFKNKFIPDSTPGYLRRTSSFRDRLISATGITGASDKFSKTLDRDINQRRPSHQRPMPLPKKLSQMVQNLRNLEDSMFEDDLDALREIENEDCEASIRSDPWDGEAICMPGNEENISPSNSTYYLPVKLQKKGQKRTTRKTIIRPTKIKITDMPKFVVSDEDQGDLIERLEQSQSCGEGKNFSSVRDVKDCEFEMKISQADDFGIDQNSRGGQNKPILAKGRADTKAPRPLKASKTVNLKQNGQTVLHKTSPRRSESTINPNAHAHLNFRTLKIRNKNSKARGAGRFPGRYARARR